jgi:Zinc knuckle
MTFAQNAALVVGNNGLTHEGIECYQCNSYGHYATECPERAAQQQATSTGTTLVQYAYMLAQAGADSIDPNWILLDSQSTISVFKNHNMLTNIRPSQHVLRALTNGGHQDSDMVGDFPNLGTVWYNKHSIANILSLSDVRKVCRVTMDTSEDTAMCVHRLDGSVMRFVEHESGLYVFNSTNNTVTAYTLLNTVTNQKKMFSQREVTDADAARSLYRKLGRPSESEFQHILRNNFVHNCPVTADDAHRAMVIYGPDIAVLKGKTTRGTAAARAPTFIATPIPAPVMEHHRNVTLCVDFVYVQGHPFFTLSPVVLGTALCAPSLTGASSPYWHTSVASSNSITTAVLPYATYTPTTNLSASARPFCLSSWTSFPLTAMSAR